MRTWKSYTPDAVCARAAALHDELVSQAQVIHRMAMIAAAEHDEAAYTRAARRMARLVKASTRANAIFQREHALRQQSFRERLH